ncbi:MAG: vWA domain-containing protein [Dehalococcoidia bacterium]
MPVLSGSLTEFCRLLRHEGLVVTPGRTLDAARSLAVIDPTDELAFRAALRANLTISVDEFPQFDKAFDRFWLGIVPPSERSATPKVTTIDNRPQVEPLYVQTRVPLEGMAPEGDARLPGGDHTAGDADLLIRKDFAAYDAADLPRLQRLIQQVAPSLATVRSRRWEAAPSGEIDIRKTIQRARRTGGDPLALARRRPKLRKLRVVALCDVSGSMDTYSRHLLQFFYALQLQGAGVRTFVFSTRLRDLTSVLRRKRFEDVLWGLSSLPGAWSGGTSIGACLEEFNRRFGKQLLSPRTVVVIASDGWERGDASVLRREMQRLRRRCYRVIWLNPLKAREGYQPLAAGMAAALPSVDHFLPAASLSDLLQLKRTLLGL